jgi:hypothetical protein
LAAIPLLVGVVITGFWGADILRQHDRAQCAHAYVAKKIITMPDGTSVRFPEDMTDDQIRVLILQKFPDVAKTAAAYAQAAAVGPAPPDGYILDLNANSLFAPDDSVLSLKEIGCSGYDWETVTYGEARRPYGALLSEIPKPLGIGLAITLAVSLVIYALVRAIGWVIGGFAAS